MLHVDRSEEEELLRGQEQEDDCEDGTGEGGDPLEGKAGSSTIVLDSPIFPDELLLLPPLNDPKLLLARPPGPLKPQALLPSRLSRRSPVDKRSDAEHPTRFLRPMLSYTVASSPLLPGRCAPLLECPCQGCCLALSLSKPQAEGSRMRLSKTKGIGRERLRPA